MALLRLDGAGAIIDANDTFRAWLDGTTAPDLRGTRLSSLLSVGGRIYWETHLAPLLRLQDRVEEIAVELRTADGRRQVLLSAERHGGDDPADVVIDVALFDARERSRYERELLAARAEAERSATSVRTLLTTTTALARAAGVDGVCDALVRAAVEEFRADSAWVWLVDATGAPELRAQCGGGPPAGELTTALRAALRDGTAPGGSSRGAGRGAATPVDEVEVTPEGHVVVPLRGADALHGVLVLVPRAHAGDDELDRDALAAAGQQGGVALDRAVLHEQSVSVAHELQRAMLTEHLPQPEGARLSTDYRPAERTLEVGGDWYDAFWVDDTVLALTVGDIVGHGLKSATAMGQLRTVVRSHAERGVGPAQVLARVDRFVQRHNVGFGSTLVYAELDLTTGRLEFACAGHPPPLVTRADGEATFLWTGRWMPLGVASRPVRPPAAVVGDRSGRHLTDRDGEPSGQGSVELGWGDVLWLYTDGMVERHDRPLLTGLDELAQAALGTAGALAGELVSSLLGDGLNEYDDACVLRVERD